MGYDRGYSLPFDSEPNGIPFGSESEGKLSLLLFQIGNSPIMFFSFGI